MKCSSIVTMTIVGSVLFGSAAFAKTCTGGGGGSADNAPPTCPGHQAPPVCTPPACPGHQPPPVCAPKPPPPCAGDTSADSSAIFGVDPPLAGPPSCKKPALGASALTSASTPCNDIFGSFSPFGQISDEY